MEVEDMNTPFSLLPSQIPHATRLADSLRAHGCALDASSPGAGKTYIACVVAASLDMRPMVITTKATLPAWVRTARGFGLGPVGIVNYERIRMGKMEECMKIQRRLKGRSKSLFHWRLPERTPLVFDEVQKCRAYRSVNAQLLLTAVRQGIPRLLCSATAFVSPMDCFAIGAALKLYPDGWFWHWASEHGCRKGRFGWRFEGDEDDLRRIHRAIFPSKGSRLSLSDIPEFPETRIEALPIETGRGREIQAIYDRMKRELLVATHTGNRERLAALAEAMQAKTANMMTIILRARAAIERCKADALAELAENAAEQGESVAIFVNFRETVDLLAARLPGAATVQGGQSPQERQQVIDSFQANRCPVVICNIAAGGVGVSLHDPSGNKPRLALISPTFSAIDLTQTLGRVHRAGGARSRQLIVFADGTCENITCERVAEKCSHIGLLNDGDLTPSFLQELQP